MWGGEGRARRYVREEYDMQDQDEWHNVRQALNTYYAHHTKSYKHDIQLTAHAIQVNKEDNTGSTALTIAQDSFRKNKNDIKYFNIANAPTYAVTPAKSFHNGSSFPADYHKPIPFTGNRQCASLIYTFDRHS